MNLIRSLLFSLFFYPGTAVYVLGVILLSPFGDRTVRAIVHGWSDYHHWLVRNLLGIRMEFDGHVPEGAAMLLASDSTANFRAIRAPVTLGEGAARISEEAAAALAIEPGATLLVSG